METHKMQQQPDNTTNSSSYYHQYFHQNTTTTVDPPPFNPYASAPPVTVSPSDHVPPQYSFPHPDETPLHHRLYQAPPYYDYAIPANPNPQPTWNSYSYDDSSSSSAAAAAALPYHATSSENNLRSYGGDQGLFDFDGGVYKYNGNSGGGQTQMEESSYGVKGGRSSDSGGTGGGGVVFDDYGRPINVPGGKEHSGFGNSSPMILKAVPKAEDYQDIKSGIQKFRVKLLSEGFGQTDTDVLCQIGLDGIRILDPATSRTLKIYQLETVTRWEVLDSYIFAFWAKTSVDTEPRRIRLKSSSYTTNNILDMVTAASIQSKEMGPSSNPADLVKGSDQSIEKKKGFIHWKTLIKPDNEEKDHWVPDEAVTKCIACGTDFSAFNRKASIWHNEDLQKLAHHCRNCGDIFCDKCTQGRIALTADEQAQPVRVCDGCMAEVTQRLSNKETPAIVSGLQSHEDLARRLQVVEEEMDKKRKKTGVNPEAARMREVECPTCTVHLQVEVGASGSETIQCSVCHHPFLVAA
ncbi:hypothetical protein BUALT_Bualt04G0043600 [Buddleja alternifolia]|uniref:FYVE-type domain-containing protein n=1 Tax=Buddleja alternifolia TaxID=168488 RepID=A0AAV6XML9_9LAMI|nr:hypothetical protein BUALT_Bualt04G0043600 [Buddleja alternifolia]